MTPNSEALHFKGSEQKDAWDFLSLWSNWDDIFYFGGLYNDHQVLTPQTDGFT